MLSFHLKNRKKWFISPLLVLGIFISVYALKVFFPPLFLPAEKVMSLLVYSGMDFINTFMSREKLYEENKRLKDEIQRLKIEINNLEYLRVENDILRSYLEFKENYGIKNIVVGRIIGVSPDNWVSSFWIDVGTEKGIKQGDLVVYNGFLVGMVDKPYRSSSLILAVNDKNFRITVRTRKTGELCLYQGFDRKTGYLKYVRPEQDIRIGDVIITETVSPNIPSGIPIGIVKNISQKEGEFFRSVEISLLYRHNIMDYILVVSR